MKITIFIFAILGCLISALPLLEAQQAGHLAPRLAPRLAPHLASRLASRFINYNITSKAIITPQDNCQRNFTHNELFTLQKKFLDNFIYPNNTLQALSINSSLLAEDVQGRVDITRNFIGRELNTEYLFGLFAGLANSSGNSDAYSLLGVPVSYEITHFAASQNIAVASTLFQFYFKAINDTLPVQIQTWNVYNCKGEISMYDATFTGLWQWLEVIMMEVAQQELSKVEGKNISIDATMVYAQSKVAKSICSTAQQYCVGVLQQYENASECYEYLTNVTRFGEAYELGRNTLQCRMVHQTMVPLRPEVHCPHIGPSGGGYCDDTPSYADTLEAKYFTNYKFAYGNGSLSG